MSRFAGSSTPASGRYSTSAAIAAATHEGGAGWAKDQKTEVFTLGLTFLSDSFYESGNDRVTRYADGIRALCDSDPKWVGSFLRWLRSDANIRTAAIVGAVEAARSGLGRSIITDVCLRPDEPAEALAYHLAAHGRKLPAAVKRGIADAAVAKYSEFAAVKYTARKASVQPGDVIALTHPTPKDEHQSKVFTYLMDLRHGRDDPRSTGLRVVEGVREWMTAPSLEIPNGLTWEIALSRGVDAGLDRADLWAALITGGDHLGYMATLRNLRNMEEAKVPADALDLVAARLADPELVASSKQLPFRFYSAYHNSGTRFAWPLEQALDLSLRNVPAYAGRSLIMVDTSGSMTSGHSTIAPVTVAALFGAALKLRSPESHLVIYATDAALIDDMPTTSALKAVDHLNRRVGAVGHGTNTWPATQSALQRVGEVDRVIVLTDMQDHPSRSAVPDHLPTYVFDLGGYSTANVSGERGRYLFSGMSDQSFKLPPLLESQRDGSWPWE